MKEVNIIGICGRAGSGKDTVAELICGHKVNDTYTVKHFADRLKEVVNALAGKDPHEKINKNSIAPKHLNIHGKQTTFREVIQTVGTDVFRQSFNKDIWVDALFENYVEGISRWIIADVRFPNEAQRIKSHGGVIIGVSRDSIKKMNHLSETSVDYLQDKEYGYCDFFIENNGSLADLANSVYDTMVKMGIADNPEQS
jgi:dephospho-CoA kinase